MLNYISENNELTLEKEIKEEGEQDVSDSPNDSTSPPASQNNEQGSTLRDLLTTTAGKLRVGSTDAGIAFAPVYSMGASVSITAIYCLLDLGGIFAHAMQVPFHLVIPPASGFKFGL